MGKCCSKELKGIKNNIKSVFEISIKNNKLIKSVIEDCEKEDFKKAKKELNKNTISQLTESMDNEIISVLSCKGIKKKDIAEMLSYLKSTNEIIEIASSTRTAVKKLDGSCEALKDKTIKKYVLKICVSILNILENSYKMIDSTDTDEILELYDDVVLLEDKIDNIYMKLNKYLISNKNDKINEKKLLAALRESEKIANRALGIASLLRYPYISKE